MAKRIKWSNNEKDLIANKYVEIKDRKPNSSDLAIIREAQKILPQNRRRTNIPSIAPSLLKAIDRAKKNRQESQEANQVGQEQELKLNKVELATKFSDNEVLEYFQEIVLNNMTDTQIIEHIGTDKLLDCISLEDIYKYLGSKEKEYRDNVFQQLGVIHRRLVDITNHQSLSSPTQHKRPKATIPKIALYGPLPNQSSIIQRAFKDKANIVHVDKDHKNISIPDANVHLIWANYVSHSIQDQIKKQGGSYTIVNGGLNSIKNAIKSIISGL